jgi:molecular chaperone HtpG
MEIPAFEGFFGRETALGLRAQGRQPPPRYISPRFREVAVSEREIKSFEFQAEVKQLLDLMIHSLYSNTDVFLRELISNASDALDRLRFAGLTNSDLLPDGELGIVLRVDPQERLLTVSDNGIGMSRDEVVRDIGTIAKSGTVEFLATLKEKQGKEVPPELIGQFGVGFYGSFMAADRVTVLTRKAGEDAATRWESTGAGGFTIEETPRPAAGTDVTLHLKPAGGDGATADYANEWVLRQIVGKYSDFVAYPIRLEIEGAKEPEGGDEPLNSMKAIWTRPASEVSEDEHKEFYKHISHDWNDPLLHVSTRIEGTFDATALLYVPSVAPYDLYHREMAHRGIQLYVKRVFVMDECRDLRPEYLRFVKGVVDAEDISLNVSREMLQQDRQIEAIRKHLAKKVLEALADLMRTDFEKYLGFFAQFGPVLKEGMLDPREKRERVLDLVLCTSTAEEGKLISVAEAVERMPDDQDVIYFLTGASLETVADSPHLEAFKEKGTPVLLFTDRVDEIWLEQNPPEYKGKRWQSVGRGDVELGTEEERKEAEEERKQEEDAYGGLLARLRVALQDQVKEVRLSHRLTSSPACLVIEEGEVAPHIAELLRQAGQEAPKTKLILEVNPSHPLLAKLRSLCEEDAKDLRIAEFAELLYGQALLAEGGRLEDPAAFSRRLADLMVRAL